MIYDAQRIQQKRGPVEIRQEAGIEQKEHCHRKKVRRGPKFKWQKYSHPKGQVNRRNVAVMYWMMEEIWMHDNNQVYPEWSGNFNLCSICGKLFIARSIGLGDYCSKKCQYARNQKRTLEYRHWENCAICHLNIGIGCKKSANILGGRPSAIRKRLIARGIAERMPSPQSRKSNTPNSIRIKKRLRNRLKEVMRLVRKGGKSGRLNFTGCDTKQLADHLQRQFKRGMTWENYGNYWHVDHILPCSSFDHAVKSQRDQCWHWTNLRPLEAKENMKKLDKITHPQMSLLLEAL